MSVSTKIYSLCIILWLLIQNIGCKSTGSEKIDKNFNYLSYTRTEEEIRQTEQKIEKVYYSLVGHFVNKTQGDTAHSKLYQTQEIISVPIWRKRKGEYWFYMGRFKNNFVENAIVEGIFRVFRVSIDTVGLQFYELPSDGDFKDEWRKESPFKDYSPADLQVQRDCISYIVKKDDNAFEIFPGEYPCPSTLSFQIHYYDLGGIITPDIFYYYGSYYNENSEPVVEYLRYNPLVFLRLNKNEPKY